jgi:hypothetical protein
MRFSASNAANAFAWAVLIGLVGVAFVLVMVLGPFGLILLGVLGLFVCTSSSLHEDTPTWGTAMFSARSTARSTPEQSAAMREEKAAYLSPLRFYRWCSVALIVAGAAGFVWQQLQ